MRESFFAKNLFVNDTLVLCYPDSGYWSKTENTDRLAIENRLIYVYHALHFIMLIADL